MIPIRSRQLNISVFDSNSNTSIPCLYWSHFDACLQLIIQSTWAFHFYFIYMKRNSHESHMLSCTFFFYIYYITSCAVYMWWVHMLELQEYEYEKNPSTNNNKFWKNTQICCFFYNQKNLGVFFLWAEIFA